MSADDRTAEAHGAPFDGGGSAPEDAARSARVDQLYREHFEKLRWFLEAKLNSWSEARDVAQEAYVRLFQLDQHGAISHLRAYLYRIAGNIATDRLRERRRRARDFHQVAFMGTLRENPSPEALCIAEQERRRLEQAIAELPPKCRMAFTLTQFDGERFEDVAQRMGIKPNSVYQYVSRAYAHLSEALISAGERPKGDP